MISSVSTRTQSVYALYVRQIGMITAAFIFILIGLMFFLSKQLKPFYHDEIFKSIYTSIQRAEPELSSAILRKDFDSAYRYVERRDFLENVKSKRLNLFSLADYPKYGLKQHCSGEYKSKSGGDYCLTDSLITIEVPIKSADNTLAHIQVTIVDNILSWNVLRLIGAALCLAILSAIGAFFTFIRHFRQHVALPVAKAVAAISKVQKEEEFTEILKDIRFQELASVTSALFEKTQEMRQVNEKLHLHETLDRVSGQIDHDIRHQINTIGSILDTTEMENGTREILRSALTIARETLEDKLKQAVDTDTIENGSGAGAHKLAEPLAGSQPIVVDDECAIIGGAINSIVRELSCEFKRANIHVVTDVPQKLQTVFVPVSGRGLHRIFGNLLKNAIAAIQSHTRGQAAELVITASLSGGRCNIVLKDSGPGISDEVLQKIALSQKVTTKPDGSGVGLSSVNALLQKIGGKIGFSRTSDGTVVEISLPTRKAPAWFYNLMTSKAVEFLILDDDAGMADRVRSAFPGKQIFFTSSERELLSAAQAKPTALCLVDCEYGAQRDGITLIQEANLHDRAVLVSGLISCDSKIRRRAIEAKVFMFPKECLSG